MRNINLFIEANRRGCGTITYYGEYTAPRTTLSFTRLPGPEERNVANIRTKGPHICTHYIYFYVNGYL